MTSGHTDRHGLPDWLEILILAEFEDGTYEAFVHDHCRLFGEVEMYEIWWCPWPGEKTS